MMTLLVICLASPVYLLFTGQVTTTEVATMAVVALLAAGWAALVRRCAAARFGYTAGIPRLLGRLPAILFGGTWRATGVMLRVALTGGSPAKATTHSFRPGKRGSRADRTRRALAVLAACAAPDSFIVRVADNSVLRHTILARKPSPDPEWLL